MNGVVGEAREGIPPAGDEQLDFIRSGEFLNAIESVLRFVFRQHALIVPSRSWHLAIGIWHLAHDDPRPP